MSIRSRLGALQRHRRRAGRLGEGLLPLERLLGQLAEGKESPAALQAVLDRPAQLARLEVARSARAGGGPG